LTFRLNSHYHKFFKDDDEGDDGGETIQTPETFNYLDEPRNFGTLRETMDGLQHFFENRIHFNTNPSQNGHPSLLDRPPEGPLGPHWDLTMDETDYDYFEDRHNDIFMPFEEMFLNSPFRRRTSTVNIVAQNAQNRLTRSRELASVRPQTAGTDVANPSIMGRVRTRNMTQKRFRAQENFRKIP
jgi:hypothetical protein